MGFTKEQEQAIKYNGSNILVSAAAGAGKTTVLVARIINKVINEKVDIDKLLVVTFTKAAASEMKERLLKAIYEELDKNPNDSNLQRQIGLINHAHISTIHSFCLDVIKNNFFETDLSANFRIADDSEQIILKEEAIEKIFQDKYEINDKEFINLLNLYAKYGDDSDLKEIILKLFDFISSVPNPDKWLEDACERINVNKETFSETLWAKLTLEKSKKIVESSLYDLKQIREKLREEPELIECYDSINHDLTYLENVDLSNFDLAYKTISIIEFSPWSRKRKFSSDEISGLKAEAKGIRDKVKKQIEKMQENYFPASEDETIAELKEMYQVLKKIKELLFEFEAEYTRRKREKNIIDYSDIEHTALKLLIDENGEKTEIAKKYDFEEILVDEYQDSNLVQDNIFKSVSNGHNVFMVGDVKQCIYRFREAMPELFLDKYKRYSLLEDEQENNKKDTKIQLYKNFRSRENVVDFINRVFQNLMNDKIGGIDYNEDEYLNLAAEFDKPLIDCTPELLLIETKDDDDTEIEEYNNSNDDDNEDEEEVLDNTALEARLVIQKIKELHNAGMNYKDMVILLRQIKTRGPELEKELIEAGIPVYSEADSNFLSTIEINTILSLLKIIDNPLQDIPLVTVMRSSIGGFDENDLTNIRLNFRNGPYYYALEETAKKDDMISKKVKEFLDLLEYFRKLEKELPLDELIWTIYSETGFYHYVCLMPNGNLRQANLKKLFEKAKDYEKISFKGLFNFITFIEKVGEKSGGGREAKMLGENDDVVRIMTIHKSKGLEFPVVFLCGTYGKFNTKDLRKKIIYDQELGVGMDFVRKGIKYPTIAKRLVYEKLNQELFSEEMRILYVALTRAKEKIIITGCEKNIPGKLEKKADAIEKNYINQARGDKIKTEVFETWERYLDWFELLYVYNQENSKFMKMEIINKNDLLKVEKDEESKIEVAKGKIDEDKYEHVSKLLNWRYEFESAINAMSKTSVTALKEGNIEFVDDDILVEDEGVQNKKIQVLNISEDNDEKLTPTEKGSLVHLVLEKLSDENIENTIKSLNIEDYKKEYLMENKNIFEDYMKSELFEELKQAKEIHKETPFYMNVKLKSSNENMLVQGVIDLYYVNKDGDIILVDYKTDKNINEDILRDRYKTQLELYKKAIQEARKQKVKNIFIYSTHLNKLISI